MTANQGSRTRILVADSIAEAGVDLLRRVPAFEVTVRTGLGPEALAAEARGHDGLVVRSASRVTREVFAPPSRLKVVGRAGTGVDNIDLEAATRAGVVVINTPGGNSVAAAEHTLSLLLALARNIPQAHAAMREGRWERARWVGIEVAGKVLGIVGLGRVGREVARRARGLGLEVIASDPWVAEGAAKEMGVSLVAAEALLARADFVTLHLPLTDSTRHTVDAAWLARLKRGARLINCARGELVEESALIEALDSGQLAGAALDVFDQEPPTDRRLISHAAVISTPHLGASTVEAQERVGIEIAEKIRDFLLTGAIVDAVNFPSVTPEEQAALRPVMDLAERLGRFLGQVAEGGVRAFDLKCFGLYTHPPLRPLVMAAVKGLLSVFLTEGLSYVNAVTLARERGITLEEARSNESTPYAGLLRLALRTDAGDVSVAGTLFTPEHPRLVEIDGVELECRASGDLLFFRNQDVPGVVGRVGTVLGEAGVNIAGIQLGRAASSASAVSLVSLDSPVPAEALRAIRALPEVNLARAVRI